jgi:hypothetical protein
MGLRSATTPSSSLTSGQIVSNLPVVCGVMAATCTRSGRRKETRLQYRHAATANWRKWRKLNPPIAGAAGKRRRRCSKEILENIQDYNEEGVLFKTRHSGRVLHGGAPRQHRATSSASDMPSGNGRSSHNGIEGPCALTAQEQETTVSQLRLQM